MKPKSFKVKTLDEFQELANKNDFNISKAVVDSIMTNLRTRRKKIHVLSIECKEEDVIYDITLDKNFFIDTLKDNLQHFEKKELYEECDKINKSISYLVSSSKK